MNLFNLLDNMSSQLTKYKSSGKSDSHYTIYFYNHSFEEVLQMISKKLEFVNKSIRDAYKRKMANNIIYNIKCSLENGNFNGKFNYFILANDIKCEFIPFSKNDLKLAAEWSFPKTMFMFSDKFKIKYLKMLFSTDINILNFHFDNKKLVVKYVDFMKEKILTETNVENYDDIISKYNNQDIIYTGLSSVLDKLVKNNSNISERLIRKKSVTNDEVIDLNETLVENKNNIRLEREIIGNLNNEKVNHKFLFGKKEISEILLE